MTAQIPILDISGEQTQQMADELVSAAATHGFIYIKNTGKEIPVSKIDHAFDLVSPFHIGT